MEQNKNMEVEIRVTRTTKGLRDALFDEIDRLTVGRSNPQVACAKSKLATQIIAATKLDLDYHRFVSEMRGVQAPSVKLTPIELGTESEIGETSNETECS